MVIKSVDKELKKRLYKLSANNLEDWGPSKYSKKGRMSFYANQGGYVFQRTINTGVEMVWSASDSSGRKL